MAERINPFQLRALKRRRVSREFTDPEQPGVTLTLVLWPPDALDMANTADLAAEMETRYVTGDEELGAPAFPFQVGDDTRRLSAGFCRQIATITCMQPPEDVLGYPPYSFEELATLAFAMRTAWFAVVQWSTEIMTATETERPKASAASSDPISVTP